MTFAFWCIPQLFFYGAYALLGQVLNARGSFGPYMWAPVVNNVVSIVGFVLFIVLFQGVKRNGVVQADDLSTAQATFFALSATLGVVAQAAVLVPALRRAGVRYRPRWGLRGSGLGVGRQGGDVDAGRARRRPARLRRGVRVSPRRRRTPPSVRRRDPWPVPTPTTWRSSSSCCRTRS